MRGWARGQKARLKSAHLHGICSTTGAAALGKGTPKNSLKAAQIVSDVVGRCESSVEGLVWSRAIDQCAKCVVNVKK